MERRVTAITRFKKLSPLAQAPRYATGEAAGADLVSVESVELMPNERKLVRTGISVEFHVSYSLLICPRSGEAFKHGVTVLNAPGVVDSDYRGEVKVMLINLGDKSYKVEIGQRIAQALLVPIGHGSWVEVEELNTTARGDGGFGHTGS